MSYKRVLFHRFPVVLLMTIMLLPPLARSQSSEAEALYALAARLQLQEQRQQRITDSLAQALGLATEFFTDGSRTGQLMKFIDGMPRYNQVQNAEGAAYIHTSDCFSGGGAGLSLSGSGQTLGIWDGGAVLSTHQELTGRVTQQDGAAGSNYHATHVAGTLIASGVDSDAKGMSPAADLDAWDWNSDASEMATAAASGLKVSQHSYGYIEGWEWGSWSGNTGWHWFGNPYDLTQTEAYGFGFYDSEVQGWDDIAHTAPHYLIVKSAGNDRGYGPSVASQPVEHWVWSPGSTFTYDNTTVRELDGGTTGYDCIGFRGNAKNILTVGAVSTSGTLASFSSCGPTDDGRIKPDIVAKGLSVYSSYNSSDVSYATMQGTSMAGPMISGSVGLLLEHQENLHPGTALLSSTIKGLILHTATDLGNTGPDYQFGWGLMNTAAAAALMSSDASAGGDLHVIEGTLADGQTTTMTIRATGSEALRATLVWNDVPGTPVAISVDPTDLMLVNDLDMRITDAGGATTAPYILDPSNPSTAATTGDNYRDNVECVNIASPGTGQLYTLTISHKGTLDGGSQAYSLIISGNEAFDYTYVYGASDDDSYYSGGWNSGDNGGTGFGDWTLTTGGVGNRYIGGTGLEDPSFGIYSGDIGLSNYFTASRALPGAIPEGSSITFRMGYTGVSGGGNIGVSFFAGGSFRLTFKFVGGDTYWLLNDGGADFSTTIPWSGNTEVSFSLTRGSGNNYSLSITQGAVTYTATDYTASSGTMAIDRIDFFSTGQGGGENLGFNDLAVTTDLTQLATTAQVMIAGEVTVSSDWQLADLFLESGNTVTIGSTASMEVSGSVFNTAGSSALVISSDASGTGALVHQTDDVDATLQRYIQGSSMGTTSRYHTASVPMTQAGNPLSGLFLDSYLYRFDAPTQAWEGYGTPTTTPLTVDQGYLIWYTGSDVTYTFAGAMNNGAFTCATPSGAASAGPVGGFNLVPNPYPSPLDWDETTGISQTNVDNTIWIYNRSSGNYGSYVRGGSGTLGVTHLIPTGQAFFVQATTDGDPVLVLGNAARTTGNSNIIKPQGSGLPELRFTVDAGLGYDEAVVVINDQSTAGFDRGMDAVKVTGSNKAPQLYSLWDDLALSIANLPLTPPVTEVLLGFGCTIDTEGTLRWSGTESLPEDMTLMLEDILTGTLIDMRVTDSLPFAYVAGSDISRFRLLMGSTVTALPENPDREAPRLTTSEHRLHIYVPGEASADAQVQLYTLDGRSAGAYSIACGSWQTLPVPVSRQLVIVRTFHHGQVHIQRQFIP